MVGWEANNSGKLAPRQVDLAPSMDPCRLAESAVTLNVSLMRWRAAPSLGIDRLQDLKILLLGAGTTSSSISAFCMQVQRLLMWCLTPLSLLLILLATEPREMIRLPTLVAAGQHSCHSESSVPLIVKGRIVLNICRDLLNM